MIYCAVPEIRAMQCITNTYNNKDNDPYLHAKQGTSTSCRYPTMTPTSTQWLK